MCCFLQRGELLEGCSFQPVAGELAIKSQPQDVGPFATAIVERLVPILAAPAGSMPRSIIENR